MRNNWPIYIFPNNVLENNLVFFVTKNHANVQTKKSEHLFERDHTTIIQKINAVKC